MISTSGNKDEFLKNEEILCRGFTNSPIDIHKSCLESSHLFGNTSFDSCFNLFKTKIFIESRERCEPVKRWLHII